jgi:hypothetical protein
MNFQSDLSYAEFAHFHSAAALGCPRVVITIRTARYISFSFIMILLYVNG